MPTNFSYKIKTTPQGNIPELNSSCCQGQLPILMSKLTASCSSVICFSCPTCSGENCSLPPSLQLTLTDLKTSLLPPWNKPDLPSSHPSHCWVISSCSTFSMKCSACSWTPYPREALLLSHEEGPHHAPCRLHFSSHIPQQFLFIFLAAHCCHAQLVTGYNPKAIFLYHCCPSTLSCAIL